MTKRITIVSTWYGPDTAGGAEVAARNLAIALHNQGAVVEVWSTTARDLFAPRLAYYPVGTTTDEGVPVQRFALSPALDIGQIPRIIARNRAACLRLKEISPDPQELRVLSSHPHSDELLAAIRDADADRVFIFVPYPLPICTWGVLLAPHQSYVLPCMHDEPYAYHALTRWQMRHARGLLANSRAEQVFLQQTYGLSDAHVTLTRLGIDMGVQGNGEAFRREHQITTPMLFFAGRRDVSKNVPLLIHYVQEYIIRRQRMITLVLSGRDALTLPSSQRHFVRDVGFLSEQSKADAFAACDVFVHAGTQESFAFVLMEAWLQGRPALVNRDCTVTYDAMSEAQAGLAFRDFGEFATALDLLLDNPGLRHQLGQAGRTYVQHHCQWSDVAHRVLATVLADTPAGATCA